MPYVPGRPGQSPDGLWYTVHLPPVGSVSRLAIIGPGLTEPLYLQTYGGYAWSPDSRTLAYGKVTEVDERTRAHWRPWVSSLCLLDMVSGLETILVMGDEVNFYSVASWDVAGELRYIQAEEPPDREGMDYYWVVDPGGGVPECLGGGGSRNSNDWEAIPGILHPFAFRWIYLSPDGTAPLVDCTDSSSGSSPRDFVVVLDPATGTWGLAGEGRRPTWSPVRVPHG